MSKMAAPKLAPSVSMLSSAYVCGLFVVGDQFFRTYPHDNLVVAFLMITSKRVSIIFSISCSSSLFHNEVCTG